MFQFGNLALKIIYVGIASIKRLIGIHNKASIAKLFICTGIALWEVPKNQISQMISFWCIFPNLF